MEHELKIKEKFFWPIVSGRKTFEIRKDDRGFKMGDDLILNPFDADPVYNLPKIRCRVVYILHHEDFPDGIPEGYCVMSIRFMDKV